MSVNGNLVPNPAGSTSPIFGHDQNNIIFNGGMGTNIVPLGTNMNVTDAAGVVNNVVLNRVLESPKNTFFWLTIPSLNAGQIGSTLQFGGAVNNTFNVPGIGTGVNSNVLNLNYIFHDDDSNTLLPKNSDDIDTLSKLMKKSFVMPLIDGGGGVNDVNIDFYGNFNSNFNSEPVGSPKNTNLQQIITNLDNSNFSKNNKRQNYWTCHILSAFQGDFQNDHDPNLENIIAEGRSLPLRGIDVLSQRNVSKGCYSSLIFLESIRDTKQANRVNLNIAHELGHQFGLSHGGGDGGQLGTDLPEYGAGMGIMYNLSYKGFYNPRHKNLIRSRVKSPGQN